MPKLGDRHPLFARFWRLVHRRMDPLRRPVAAAARGRVLEIGAGGGSNLPFLAQAEDVVLTDPDPEMLRQAEAAVRRLGRPARIVPAAAESLPFAGRSFDAVVCTLVLCSVEDQAAALSEVRRVLKPGGSLHFLEHVRSEHPLWSRFQDLVTPVQRYLFAGCHPNRDTLGALRRAGFDIADLVRPEPRLPIFAGVARPREGGP